MLDKFDRLGRPLTIGDKVIYAISLKTDLYIGEIVRFTKLMVYLKSGNHTAIRYPRKVVKI